MHKRIIQMVSLMGLVLCSFTPSTFAGAMDELTVEGVVYEAKDESKSIAVINGEFLKEGDSYKDYQIIKIKQNAVSVLDKKSGDKVDLRITGARPKEEAAEKSSDAAEGPEKSSGFGWNPFGVLARAHEVGIIASLKQVHIAALAYYHSHEPVEEVTLEQLIKEDLISEAYGEDYKGYRFSIDSSHDDIEAHADPVNPNPNANHFIIDKHGMVRVEKGKPATRKSQLYNS